MVATEAMQCGTVLVVFDSFAAASSIITHNEDGILMPPFNLSRYERNYFTH
ncbi:MAG: hypothetical protein LUE08_00720 [Akkermansiaceae bacterium]|nr:hypothetical protein [Akkermansiaceae bacterium]